jgi:hypothetical protein
MKTADLVRLLRGLDTVQRWVDRWQQAPSMGTRAVACEGIRRAVGELREAREAVTFVPRTVEDAAHWRGLGLCLDQAAQTAERLVASADDERRRAAN